MSPRGRRPLVGALLSILCLSLLPGALTGQGRLQVDVAPSQIVFPRPGVPEFDAGSVLREGVVVDVEARGFVIWSLTIRADGPDLGGYGKPLSDLQWRQPGDDWQPVATTEQVVAFGFGSREIELDFRTLLQWGRDVPGSYGTGLVFEVASVFGAARVTGTGRAPSAEAPGTPDPGDLCARAAVGIGRAGVAPASGGRRSSELERRCLRDLGGPLRRARRPGAASSRPSGG